MPGSVRDLPGVRPGARVFLFTSDDMDGITSRIEDFDADWIGIAAPSIGEIEEPLRPGDPLELELPQPGGSLFLTGRLVERVLRSVPILVCRIDEVGADPGIGNQRETRRHFRQTAWLPVKRLAYLHSSGAWREASGVVRDVSGGGLSLLADADLPVGTRVWLDAPVPLDPIGLRVSGTSVGCRQIGTPRRRRWVTHIRFDGLDRVEEGWLVTQLHRYQWLVRWRNR